jgi:hypothetical protein
VAQLFQVKFGVRGLPGGQWMVVGENHDHRVQQERVGPYVWGRRERRAPGRDEGHVQAPLAPHSGAAVAAERAQCTRHPIPRDKIFETDPVRASYLEARSIAAPARDHDAGHVVDDVTLQPARPGASGCAAPVPK